MTRVEFDQWGNPIPYTLIPLTLSEVEINFSDETETNSRRKWLLAEYKRYYKDFRTVLGEDFHQWLGGSFVSRKPEPSDIDVVNLIAYSDALDERLDELMPFF